MTTTQDGKIHEPWWIAWVLGLLLALSWADRGLPGILLGSIKKSLLVTDAQLGLLSGTAFGICYAIAGIPVAWLADRSSRSRLISVGVVIWSLLTAFSAMAANFGTLFVARMGVGIGEAVLLPCAYSLIADTFSRNARARAASILVLGTPIGAGIALWCGAVLLDYFSRTNVLPALHLEPWRMVFLTMGAVGILVGVIPMMLKEPRRTAEIADRVRHSPGALRFLVTHWRRTVPIAVGITLFNMFGGGFIAWLAPLFVRHFHMPVVSVGRYLGVGVVILGAAAIVLGGVSAAKLTDKYGSRGPVLLALLSTIFLGIATIVLARCTSSPVAAVSTAVCLLSLFAATPAVPLVVMSVAPSEMRARVAAALILVAGLLGSSTGPWIFGWINDSLSGDGGQLNVTFGLSALFMLGVASAVLLISFRQRFWNIEGETY